MREHPLVVDAKVTSAGCVETLYDAINYLSALPGATGRRCRVGYRDTPMAWCPGGVRRASRNRWSAGLHVIWVLYGWILIINEPPIAMPELLNGRVEGPYTVD
jgi:hypothetical protein